MITVHHLNNSRSQRVLWLLEELELPYEIVRYQRSANMLAPPELRAIHPLGKSPVVTEDGRVVAESGAIIEYLLETRGANAGLRPAPGTPEARRFTHWLHFAEGSAMPPLVMKLVFQKVKSAPMPFFVKPIARGIAEKVLSTFIDPNLKRQIAFMEAELAHGPWFAGAAFSAADIQMSFPVEAAATRSGAGTLPNVKLFLDRIHERPAYRRAIEKGAKVEILG